MRDRHSKRTPVDAPIPHPAARRLSRRTFLQASGSLLAG